MGLVDELDHPQISLFVMAFGLRFDKVALSFNGPMKDRTVALREISSVKANTARLHPFRYLALAYLGSSCLERFVGLSAEGVVLFDSELMHCREGE
jgi:hypothetical protein